jgi:hypothetical protein
MADEATQEVRLLRAISRNSEPLFVTHEASEEDSTLYNRSTGMIQVLSASVNSGSLQSFNVGENKVKYLFKVE